MDATEVRSWRPDLGNPGEEEFYSCGSRILFDVVDLRWQRIPPDNTGYPKTNSAERRCLAVLTTWSRLFRLSHSQGSVTSNTLPKTSGSKVHEPLASRPRKRQRFCCLLPSSLGESRVSGTILDPGFWFIEDKG